MGRQHHLWQVIFLLTTALLSGCEEKENNQPHRDPKSHKENMVPAQMEFGFNMNTFRVWRDTVKENWTLSHMLLPHGISQLETNLAYVQCKDSCTKLDFIKPGDCYLMLYPKNDTTKARYCIYKVNDIDYVVFDFNDSVRVYRQQKEYDLIEREVAGIVRSSLWQAFIDEGLSPLMAFSVTNIYQWTVNFFAVQPGDYFKMIFDEKQIDGKSVGFDQIKAIEFHTLDTSYFAIQFAYNDSLIGYWDKDGNSLRRALLKAPLDYIRVTSGFSHSRMHPILKVPTTHHGVDFGAPAGTPVYSVGDGVITFAGWAGGAGNFIKIQHPNNIETQYMHLLNYAMGIRNGAHVKQGQKIGEVGSTGLSTGPHLDYRIYINGTAVDPLNADIPTSEPLPDSIKGSYLPLRDELIKRLNAIKMQEAG